MPTIVHDCAECGHLQTDEIPDVDAYYEENYDILVGSEDEDQIYEIRNGVPYYRTQHQVDTLLAKITLRPGMNLLDYGGAKSSTIRALLDGGSHITPHVFDVSGRYVSYWEKFISPENWATHITPSRWESRFDVVTSFFSLEHMPQPADSMRKIARLLKDGGSFYGVVPNVITNIADLIVVDHCNHFTRTSLAKLMADAGFEVMDIDDLAHRGAFVVVARKANGRARIAEDAAGVAASRAEARRIADFWRSASDLVRAGEAECQDHPIAIYGAGFYGAFIAANLAKPDRIACYLDQNPFLKNRLCNGKPILHPRDLPADISAVFVGLNPSHARQVIAEAPGLSMRDLRYFYL